MQRNVLLGLVVLFSSSSISVHLAAQDAGALQKKVTTEFTLTKTTADRSDIVTAGAVLVLHKDGVVMYSSSTSAPPMNIYKDGKIQRNEFKDRAKVWGNRFKIGNSDTTDINSIPKRTFVADEKFWMTAVETQQDGLVLTVYSDPFNDVRYYGQIKFPYPKNSPPPADDLLKTVEEVITVAPPSDDDKNDKADNAPKGGKGAPRDSGGAQSATAPAPAMAPIAPPPPPPDQPPAQPKTISVGQTKDVVVAMWGQPTKVVKLSSKEIYFYPDMKVTFVAGKVSTVD